MFDFEELKSVMADLDEDRMKEILQMMMVLTIKWKKY